MKTFQEFIEEGKNKNREEKIKNRAKEIKKEIKKSRKEQLKQNPDKPVVLDYGESKPNSPERLASIQAMMDYDKQGRQNMKKNLP
jgi:hypothetical protein